MSDTSLVLSLPYIQPSQAQKHVTHNEAIEVLDVLVQANVKAMRAEPPGGAVLGERYIVAEAATGEWAGHETEIACYSDTVQGWRYFTPQVGWLVYTQDTATVRVFNGQAWGVANPPPETMTRLGISTSADSVNRFAVASDATLLTHAGAGHQVKVNKASATDTASLLFQDNWSGRAEMGLAGSDDFQIKVSADGGTFRVGLTVAAQTGRVGLPQGAEITGRLTGTAVQQSATDATSGRLLAVGAYGLGGSAPLIGDASVVNVSIVPGFYTYDTSQSSVGGPAVVQRGILMHQRRTTGGGEVQVLYAETGVGATVIPGAVFTRSRVSGAWSAWCSGGIIDSGNNARGRYRRHQDGTLTCWQTVTTAAGAELALQFPVAFVSTTDLVTTLGVNAATLGALCPRFTARTVSGMNLSVFNNANSRVAASVDVVTIGRWY